MVMVLFIQGIFIVVAAIPEENIIQRGLYIVAKYGDNLSLLWLDVSKKKQKWNLTN